LAYETVLNFGLQTGREFYQVTPANSNKCWAYNENPTNEGPNPDTLQFDAAAHNTAWNQRCIEIMAQKIRDDKERFMLPDTVTDKQLYEILLSRWQKLHGKWNETNARMLPTGRFETVQEVASRISKAKVNIKHSENARSRRRTKFQTRKEIVKEEIEGLNRGNPNDEQELRFWTWLLEVLVHLDVEGMSSTESDTIQATGDRVYFTHLVGWRRQEIGEKLRKVDERRDAIKNAAGNRPVTKTYTNQPSRRKHRDGIPRIIYDQEWLASNEKTLRVKVSEEQMEFLDYILPSMTRNS
jgi:hypothetical protein